jgi:hypothetical protein
MEWTLSGPVPRPLAGDDTRGAMTYPRSRARLGPVLAPLRRGLAVCLGGLLLATPALGATYFLSNSGSDSATGTSPSTAWATLAQANSRVAPGDVVVMAAGTYAGYPAPAVSGTATQRITYVGSLSAPGSVVVTGTSTTISASHLTLKGMYLVAGFSLTGVRDSVAYCRVGGDRSQIADGDDCVVAQSTISSQRFWFFGEEEDSVRRAVRDTLQDCTFVLNMVSGIGHTMHWRGLDSCVVNRCRFLVTVGPEITSGGIHKMFWMRQCKFTDCFWEATNNRTATCDECGWFLMRDFSNRNSFVRDTIILHGPGEVLFMPNMSGSYPGTNFGNSFDHCLFRVTGTNSPATAVYMQDAVNGDSYRYCTIIGADRGIKNAAGIRDLTFEHNTVVGFGPERGAWYTEDCDALPWAGTNRVVNNIFASMSPLRRAPGTSGTTAAYPAVFWYSPVMAGRMVGDYNLYFTAMGADSAIMGGNYEWSRPGPGSVWNVASGADGNSRFGDPLFAETTSAATFSPLLRTGSPAIGHASDGTDIGAVPFAGAGDVTPPGTVSDLASVTVDTTRVTLGWTSAGDDGFSGTATICDLRWSTAPITSANFAAATPASPAPTPATGGTAVTYTVSPLSPGTTCYFAVRAMDNAGNWSEVSNVVQATLPGRDVTPPARIGDLRFP